ncbi:bifunctional pyr operon transcriptional regulator/uracil phosphoribosyltransferase PyrR [Thermoleophilia bacterium SCSIO 60948]|nr:bifunctional pyr operon transcriptional regulator/uracil phosphoribosyltransferase PyrR [Thermoleophilia bacterium SCSIO 60948]
MGLRRQRARRRAARSRARDPAPLDQPPGARRSSRAVGQLGLRAGDRPPARRPGAAAGDRADRPPVPPRLDPRGVVRPRPRRARHRLRRRLHGKASAGGSEAGREPVAPASGSRPTPAERRRRPPADAARPANSGHSHPPPRRPPPRVVASTASVPLTTVQRGREGARVAKLASTPSKTVLDRDDLRRTTVRIAHQIVEKNPGAETGSSSIALVGIHTRGAVLARRLHELVAELSGVEVPLGDIDISFYRDDLTGRPAGPAPVVHASHLDFDLSDRTVILVDDVMYTGRTARAAIEALFDYGRPARVQLAVLADRGHRELPIRPDYVGKNLPTARSERVTVRLEEVDGVDEVTIEPVPSPEAVA